MNITKNYRKLTLILTDSLGIVISYLLTVLILYMLNITVDVNKLLLVIPIIVIVSISLLSVVGTYKVLTRYLSFGSITIIASLLVFLNLGLAILNAIPSIRIFHPISYIIIAILQMFILSGYRIFIRFMIIYREVSRKEEVVGKRTLILGAGSAGEIVLKELLYNNGFNNYVVGFLDDDTTKVGRRILNKDVLGEIRNVDFYIKQYAVEEIILAINNISKEKEVKLINIINQFSNVKLKKINVISEYLDNNKLRIVDVNVEDLLDREPINLETKDLAAFIKDEVVLVTGGGGSIGSELSRQIFALRPKTLIIFDIYENNAYDIQVELERILYKNQDVKTKVVTLIGSVYNKKRVEEVFNQYKPTLVFHAAAYKHVPLMEESSREAVRTNVLGTKTISEACNKFGVKKMVLVSSDKAVRSTNVMGATKRYAELIINENNKTGPTKFSAVRFGNVLGSKGSVIPLFTKQIEDGGPITVTHKEIVRYFMTIPQSVGLILQSAIYANGGEIFVLDMGSPVKIYDLAEKMISLAGFTPHKDIEIEITGLRPGEKLYEELLIDTESNSLRETSHSRIFVETNIDNLNIDLDFDYVLNNFEELSNEKIKGMLNRVIPSYRRTGENDES